MAKLKIKKKDTVLVLSGKDKGRKGEVLRVYPDGARVLIAKVNMTTKHAKPRPPAQPGGIQKREAPIHISKVMLVCSKCEQAVRPKLDKLASGERVRVCRNCGEVVL
ncbi:MAG: 50S ribosomal protein L24 [Elusimicrobia bacterium]|nr:50S ribosomal protein L24 [Elusimicrobiota bacterium]